MGRLPLTGLTLPQSGFLVALAPCMLQVTTMRLTNDRLMAMALTLNRIWGCLMALVPYIFQVATMRLTSTRGRGSLMALALWVFRVTDLPMTEP